MKAGMIIRSKSNLHDQQWFIKKVGEIKRNHRGFITMIKGYRVAPLEDLDNDFWVTEEQLHRRFEEAT
jgi:hypothetical protein